MNVNSSTAALSAAKDWASELRATQAKAGGNAAVAAVESTEDGRSLAQLVEDKRSAILAIGLAQVPDVTYSQELSIKAAFYLGPRNAEEKAIHQENKHEITALRGKAGDAWEAFKAKIGFENMDFGFTLDKDGSILITDGKDTKLTFEQKERIEARANESKLLADNARALAKSIIEYVGMSDNTRHGLGRFHLDVENFSQNIDLGLQFNVEATNKASLRIDPNRPRIVMGFSSWSWQSQLIAKGENRYQLGMGGDVQRGSAWDGNVASFTGWKSA
ncbi:hypothetical protein ACLBKS_11985 [Hylemonella sp. W303a]|uniref:hypothetical protein n=1 Tax=Hylemonella sp. W303a TaxID=3389873 RepID=UPI00396B1A40